MRFKMHLLALSVFAMASCDEVEGVHVDDGALAGRCVYTNPFAQVEQCKAYVGLAWTEHDALSDCSRPMIGADEGIFEPGLACPDETLLGRCFVEETEPAAVVLHYPATEALGCNVVETGCNHAGGVFVPGAVCPDPAGAM